MKTDNTDGLRGYAAMMIKTMAEALERSPYTQGPDKAELQVRFWSTLASMAQNRCGLAKAALGGEGLTSAGYMTRKEAAAYLRISTRQLDRMKLPVSIVGQRPRYSRAALDTYIKSHSLKGGYPITARKRDTQNRTWPELTLTEQAERMTRTKAALAKMK